MRRLLLALGQTHTCDCDHAGTPMQVMTDALGGAPGVLAAATLGGGAIAALLFLAWRHALGTKALLALWTRLDRDEVVAHPRRARLLALVQHEPGASTRELERQSGLNEGTLLHHLRTLERAGSVKSLIVGRDRLWFDVGTPRPPEEQLAALQAPARRAILDLLSGEPGLTQAELARRLALSRPTVSHHVRALHQAGRLEVRREGVRTRLYAAASG